MLTPVKSKLLLMLQSGCQSFTGHGTHSYKVFGVHSKVHHKRFVCQLAHRMNQEEKFAPKAFETKSELMNAVLKYYFNPSEKNVDIKRTYGHPIGKWDVSKIQDFNTLFHHLTDFNEDIQSWDVSSVTDMSAMFCGTKFNQDLSSWNTSQVRDMSSMFENAKSFNQDLSLWDTSEVRSMRGMFEGAVSFNRDLSSWDTSQVTDMKYMFLRAHAFNQDVSSWRTSNVTSMYGMFLDTQSFHQDLSGWDTSKVTDVDTSIHTVVHMLNITNEESN